MHFIVNGKEYSDDRDITLLDFLRNTLNFTGTKDGCSEGACGTCSVIINGKLRKACSQKIQKLDGAEIITIEGLSEREKSVYAYAFAEAGAVQCGFCIPGMVIAGKALIDAEPNPSEEDVRKAIRGNICRCTGYVKIEKAILLAARILRNNEEIPDTYDSPTISGAMNRIDAIEKTLGKGVFTDDLRIEGMVYASAIRSPFPRIRLISIDKEEAEKDVHCIKVITAEDVPCNIHGHIVPDWPVLIATGETTSYIGDSLCLVVAETREALKEIKEKVKIEYEVLPGVYTPEEALSDEILVHKGRSNLLDEERVSRGDVDKALSESDLVFEGTYTTPFTEHAFMEPECAIATPYGDGIYVWAGDQSVYDDQREIMRMLELPKEKVHIHAMLVGGGFGGKEDMSVQHHAALAAYVTKRTVNVRLTRQESLLTHPKRHPMSVKVKIGVMKDGRIMGMDADIISDTGAYASLGGPVLQRACTHASGPYSFTNFRVRGRALYTNNVPSGAFRGFGVTQSCFAVESALDEIASKLGIDPFEIRMRNALKPGDVMPNGQIAGDDVALIECLEAVRDAYYSSERTGIAVAMKNSGIGVGSHDTGRCILSVEDGKIHVRSSAACMGQGVGTVELQIAATTLGLGKELFIVEPPDTQRTPDSGTSTASRQTAFTGEAVRRAALKMKEDLDSGHSINDLEGKEYYGEFVFITDPIDSTKKNPVSHLAYSFSAQVVELDENNRVKKITAACDAGTVINQKAIEGQVEGGVLMGMGYALTEDFITEEGIVKSKYGTLGLLRATDRPEIETIMVHSEEKLETSYGAKGVGELSTIPTAPAIRNAYFRIDGISRNSLPLTGTPYSRKK